MIEKTDFPYTLGGYVEQQNYKGFDIAVSIRRYKGISAYVISSEKRAVLKVVTAVTRFLKTMKNSTRQQTKKM